MAYSSNHFDMPILPEEVIIISINEFTSIPFTIKDLREPTYEKLLTVYSAFVCNLLEMSAEQLTQIPLHVMEIIYHKELHVEDGAGHLLFVKTLSYIMQACNEDFKISDLVTPTRKGTRKLLSAIVNFVQFIARYNKKEEILDKVAKTKEDQEKYFRKKSELPTIINNLKVRRLERQRAVQELNLNAMRSKCKEIEAVKKERYIRNAALKAEVEEMQNMLTVAQSSGVIQQLKEEVELRKSRVTSLIAKEQAISETVAIAPSVYELIMDTEKDMKTCDILSNHIEQLSDKSLISSKQLKVISAEMNNINSIINGKLDKQVRLASKYSKLATIVEDTKSKLSNKSILVSNDIQSKEEQVDKLKEELKQLFDLKLASQIDHENAMKLMSEESKLVELKVSELNDLIVKL